MFLCFSGMISIFFAFGGGEKYSLTEPTTFNCHKILRIETKGTNKHNQHEFFVSITEAMGEGDFWLLQRILHNLSFFFILWCFKIVKSETSLTISRLKHVSKAERVFETSRYKLKLLEGDKAVKSAMNRILFFLGLYNVTLFLYIS